MKDQEYNSIVRRLEKIEQVVFGDDAGSKPEPSKSNFSGASGGVRFLLTQNFFTGAKRNLSEIRAELEKHDYPYSSQAVDMALRRLSKSKGPLIALKQKGRKIYARRK